jgi:hypothetical protein
MPKHLSKEAKIMQDRTAFALYLKQGMDEVERLYPDSLEFVIENQDKSLKQVTELLTKKLNAQSEILIPA